MSQDNVDLLRERYRQVNEGGFASIADFVSAEFTMDSPQGVEASQAHDRDGLQRLFEKMDEIWDYLPSIPSKSRRWTRNGRTRSYIPPDEARPAVSNIEQELTHLWTLRPRRSSLRPPRR